MFRGWRARPGLADGSLGLDEWMDGSGQYSAVEGAANSVGNA